MCQHFILYRGKGASISSKLNKDVAEPLHRSSEDPESGNLEFQFLHNPSCADVLTKHGTALAIEMSLAMYCFLVGAVSPPSYIAGHRDIKEQQYVIIS
ncbi:unnamed protein product [Dovyalis caffra]|uniref:Uncharacterized protein n=1 Tax=Dovyalis caffra TaxID=77055 RepID=A0AAV1R5E3_9ROSI|nr:unnamed protein product [Dovyalis caffra]